MYILYTDTTSYFTCNTLLEEVAWMLSVGFESKIIKFYLSVSIGNLPFLHKFLSGLQSNLCQKVFLVFCVFTKDILFDCQELNKCIYVYFIVTIVIFVPYSRLF